jgi:hypothetical protein
LLRDAALCDAFAEESFDNRVLSLRRGRARMRGSEPPPARFGGDENSQAPNSGWNYRQRIVNMNVMFETCGWMGDADQARCPHPMPVISFGPHIATEESFADSLRL